MSQEMDRTLREKLARIMDGPGMDRTFAEKRMPFQNFAGEKKVLHPLEQENMKNKLQSVAESGKAFILFVDYGSGQTEMIVNNISKPAIIGVLEIFRHKLVTE